MGLTKTLIHLHTNYSFDSNTSPEALASFVEREGFGCVAVTDHDTIEGARHLANITSARVVIGEEVTTRDGDVIGLFLRRCVAPGMSARETAVAIKEQGGLVLAPHPFVKLLGRGLGDAVWDIVDLIDAVEVCNGQNLLGAPDREADRFARRLGLARYVGSDSHMASSIAPCYQRMGAFDGPEAFLGALGSAELVSGRHPLWYFAAAACRIARHVAGLPLPRGFGVNAEVLPPGMPQPAACDGAHA